MIPNLSLKRCMFRKLASLGYPDQLYGMLLFAFHSDDKTSSRQMRCAFAFGVSCRPRFKKALLERADAWSKSGDYLCRECALKGGFTNLIYPLFSIMRENLSPFWTQTDEKFLSMCVDTTEIHETTRYIWVKARVFTRKCLTAFIEQNPSGDLNAAIHFIYAQIGRIESANLSESNSNPKK